MSLNLPRREPHMRLDPALAIVNIVLLLIFFFLAAGQDSPPPRDLQLAETSELPAGALPAPVLELRGTDQWLLDGDPILPDLLAAALAGQDGPLHVVIDRQAPSSLLLELLRRPEVEGHDIRLVTRHVGVAE
ncbi:biopolymer transport protein ExbD [Paracoccus alcaliphilus]|uniref:Biopolymer transport protein ExbD n=1 Tax=Paracoccus alcaliphilus TaxID=34002 RepID=A0A1H8KRR6_9RHOB|nr:hypothetical protein [Paracoccus alcaliphilus]WCR20444.1 biopolymer transporter ExbD [Paracoccus alcaliphilus]SEN95574.1 biopolymer transport protein ExbD [Paracoccus alcaliphilus]